MMENLTRQNEEKSAQTEGISFKIMTMNEY